MKKLSYFQQTLSLRLIRLIEVRRLQEDAMSDWCIRMVELCINSAYLDCLDAGAADHVEVFMVAYRKRQQRRAK